MITNNDWIHMADQYELANAQYELANKLYQLRNKGAWFRSFELGGHNLTFTFPNILVVQNRVNQIREVPELVSNVLSEEHYESLQDLVTEGSYFKDLTKAVDYFMTYIERDASEAMTRMVE